jgi:DNA-binding winged helix-turn-helix (wHTH) protein
VIRYRFGDFILSPRRRALVRHGREQPLIPRYFDLLVFLVRRRGEAVHRRDIFDSVWSDVIVSDSALSQAIRTIRRVLGDDSREPRFVRTVSRHGYQFVFSDVLEEDDDGDWPVGPVAAGASPETTPATGPAPGAAAGRGADAALADSLATPKTPDVKRSASRLAGAALTDTTPTDAALTDGALVDTASSNATLAHTVRGDTEPPDARTVSGPSFAQAAPFSASGHTDTPSSDLFASLIDQVTREVTSALEEEDQREAAERLHALGTAQALQRLGSGPRRAYARALLRDTRWESAEAGAVPILGQPDWLAVAWHLVRLRLRRAAGLAAARWAAASVGGGVAWTIGGAAGGLLLTTAPGSAAPLAVVPVLAVIGGGCGALGGAGVGAGLAIAESVMRSRRMVALVAGGAVGGGTVGLLTALLAQSMLAVLLGVRIEIGGGGEGLLIGGAAGLGYAAATATVSGGLAAPRGLRRLRTVAFTAIACGIAALGLALAGRALVGGTVHALAQASLGGQAALTPLGRLIGEPGFGPVTAALIGMGEGLTFGIGLALGLTRRR